jgi:hypothetical protein
MLPTKLLLEKFVQRPAQVEECLWDAEATDIKLIKKNGKALVQVV